MTSTDLQRCLENRIFELEAERDALAQDRNTSMSCCAEQLAASRAREQRLRDALTEIVYSVEGFETVGKQTTGWILQVARAALAQDGVPSAATRTPDLP